MTNDNNDGCNDNDGHFDDNDAKKYHKTYKYYDFWLLSKNGPILGTLVKKDQQIWVDPPPSFG